MSRWLMTLVCSLALAAPVFAQDDLDALLAGLGDEPAVAPAAADESVEAAPAEEVVESPVEEVPAAPAAWRRLAASARSGR